MKKIGRYEVIRELKSGGMGSVTLAKTPEGERVVLKRPHAHDEEAHTRLRDEARLGARLLHPAIVDTLDLFDDDDGPVLVVAYIEGLTLENLRREGPMPTALVARVGRQISEALDALHSATDEHGTHLHILHRDVSPGNIIIDEFGDAKLIDLGIARFDERHAENTRDGYLRGTIRYLGPELVQGQPHLPQTDLWALGLVLYEAALGNFAYPGKTDHEVVAQIVAGHPLDRKGGEFVAPEIREALYPLLQPSLDKRAPSADVAAKAFAEVENLFDAPRAIVSETIRHLLDRRSKRHPPAPRGKPKSKNEVLTEALDLESLVDEGTEVLDLEAFSAEAQKPSFDPFTIPSKPKAPLVSIPFGNALAPAAEVRSFEDEETLGEVKSPENHNDPKTKSEKIAPSQEAKEDASGVNADAVREVIEGLNNLSLEDSKPVTRSPTPAKTSAFVPAEEGAKKNVFGRLKLKRIVSQEGQALTPTPDNDTAPISFLLDEKPESVDIDVDDIDAAIEQQDQEWPAPNPPAVEHTFDGSLREVLPQTAQMQELASLDELESLPGAGENINDTLMLPDTAQFAAMMEFEERTPALSEIFAKNADGFDDEPELTEVLSSNDSAEGFEQEANTVLLAPDDLQQARVSTLKKPAPSPLVDPVPQVAAKLIPLEPIELSPPSGVLVEDDSTQKGHDERGEYRQPSLEILPNDRPRTSKKIEVLGGNPFAKPPTPSPVVGNPFMPTPAKRESPEVAPQSNPFAAQKVVVQADAPKTSQAARLFELENEEPPENTTLSLDDVLSFMD